MLTLDNLKQNAFALTGLSLGHIAAQLGIKPKQQKGWIGQLIELALQAQAGSRPMPDFPELGVELKTIPVDNQGRVKESTFVCTVNLEKLTGQHWEQSLVKKKLSHVLWVPIQSDKTIPFAERRIGQPFFWQPDEDEMRLLENDWRELTDQLQMGHADGVSAVSGEVLQIRPKGANAKSLTTAFDHLGEPCVTLPRGFYLRAAFTSQILAKSNTSLDNRV